MRYLHVSQYAEGRCPYNSLGSGCAETLRVDRIT